MKKKVAHADCISIKDLIRQHEITFNSIKHCIKSINASLKRHEKYFEKIDKKFDDIDKRFTDVDKRFSDVDMNIKNLTRDVSSIKSFLSTKYNEDIDLVGLKNSPTKLTDFGNQILKEINGINFINENKEQLISRLDEERPRTALDVENSALIVFVNFCNSEKFDGIKNFIYNSPEYKVKDKNGRDITYNLSLMNVCFILSIPLRDMYLELHPEILKNV
ncbi:MAG: hypothetical protein IKV80_10030 [Bacteroidales bacterium]|nr:hypothetical protein [Bacteroidales bacterium]